MWRKFTIASPSWNSWLTKTSASAPSGEGGKLIESGETRLGGRIPVNTSGGLKAKGHPVGATGTAQAYEMYLQLTGQADKRQVKDAKVGLTHNVGGSGATAAVHIYRSDQ